MSLKDLQLKHSYISYGEDGIAQAFINPTLKEAKVYKRSVGFFSSGALTLIVDGIMSLVRAQGKIMLIASPRLSENDVNTIKEGYDFREQILQNTFSEEFNAAINELDDDRLKMLLELVTRGFMDIKIAITKKSGMYHDKLGIIEDAEGNSVAFFGSANASYDGYSENYEKIRVVRSWISGESESVEDETEEFQKLWDNANPFVDVYDYTECAKKNLIVATTNRTTQKKPSSGIQLRDYQEEAIKAWVDNDYHGFYVMATGTGKTWTAIYSALELLKTHNALITICAPYKHLVKQWAEDVEKVFPDANIILVSSENSQWENQLNQAIIKKKYDKTAQVIVITTITSFYLKRFITTLMKSDEDKLLIVDEAHRFTRYSDTINRLFHYMLGLSATPFSGKSTEKGKALMEFFGGQVFNLPIEIALEKGFLVPYYYIPIYVHSNDDEENRFRAYAAKIASCYKNNKLVNPDLLVKSLRGRLRVISMAEEKQNCIDEIIEPLRGTDHFVVYCGDGKLFDENTGEELRHIQSVKKTLTDVGFRVSQFTAKENMNERMQLVESFNKGDISGLAAIRCLDEGINIPSIKSALILSSNDDYREFVQRRGRILRTYKGKEYANIYDVIVLPSRDMSTWASIEFRRFYEYAKLAINSEELLGQLDNEIAYYGLTIEDIANFEYEDVEVNEDE